MGGGLISYATQSKRPREHDQFKLKGSKKDTLTNPMRSEEYQQNNLSWKKFGELKPQRLPSWKGRSSQDYLAKEVLGVFRRK